MEHWTAYHRRQRRRETRQALRGGLSILIACIGILALCAAAVTFLAMPQW